MNILRPLPKEELNNLLPNNELKKNDKIAPAIEDWKEVKEGKTMYVWWWEWYGSEKYIQTPYTLYMEYGINWETNYPAKMRIEYADGDCPILYNRISGL